MRALLALLLLLAGGYFGISDAQAACYADFHCDTRSEAYSAASVVPPGGAVCANNGWGTAVITVQLVGGNSYEGTLTCSGSGYNGGSQGRWFWYAECPASMPSATWDEATHTCKIPCSAQAPDSEYNGLEPNGTYCKFGCTFQQPAITGTGVLASPTGATCAPSDPCPSGMVKLTSGDFQGACAPDSDGDGSSDSNDFAPDDPKNGEDGALPPPDSDGDGTPDEPPGPGDETDNKSSGGGNCQSPPTSSGDGILSNLLYQGWAGRCEGEKTNKALKEIQDGIALSSDNIVDAINGIDGAGGTDMTDTNAKLTELGGKADAGNGLLSGIRGVLDDIKGFFTGDGSTPGEGEPLPSVDDVFVTASDPPVFDDSGFGFVGGSCPLLDLPTFEFRGETVTIPWGDICGALEILAAMILLAGHVQAAYIFAGIAR